MKLAFLVAPNVGGVYSVYRNLRAGMAAHGAELRWVAAGPAAARAAADPAWAGDRAWGDVAGADAAGGQAEGAALVRHLESGGYDGVFINLFMSPVEMNVARYLRPDLRRILVVHSTTPATYAAARALRDHADAAVGVSPRVRDDLVRHGFSADATIAIPNALDLGPYRVPGLPSRGEPGGAANTPLRVLSLGRVHDVSKGVFWLPKIIELLRDTEARLTVAGDGPDLPELRARSRALESAGRVEFLGHVPAADVPGLVSRHDVLLMPSRFEGFGYTLVEAMAGGCVPVASRVQGATDFIVQDGRTGFLFTVGDVRGAAEVLRSLAADRQRLGAASEAARRDAAERFGAEQMAAAYLDLVRRVRAEPTRARPPLPLESWSYPKAFDPGLRRFVPGWAKNTLRVWRERLNALRAG